MRILQVCSAETIGGGERHVADLMRVLIERGHELHCAVRPASQLPSALGDLPIQWHRVGLRNALDLLSIWRLRKYTDSPCINAAGKKVIDLGNKFRCAVGVAIGSPSK